MRGILREEGFYVTGILTGCFVHDLCNRLQILIDGYEDGGRSDILEALYGLQESVKEFLSLVRHREIEFVPVDFRGLIEDVSRFLRPYLRRKGVKLRTGGYAEASAEPLLIRSALLNLVVNAVEAGAKEVVIAVYEHPDCVLVTVDDDGRPFAPTSYGLGLTSVEFVAKVHGGGLLFNRFAKVVLKIGKSRDKKIDFCRV